MSAVGTRAAQRLETTQRIYDALSRLLYDRGYDTISLADIAEEAGMARTAMYNYFSDKEQLLISYTSHETQQYLRTLDDELRVIENPVDQLRRYISLQLEYYASNHLPPGPTLRLLLGEAATMDMLKHVRDVEDRLHNILKFGTAQRYFDTEDIPSTASMISACISRGSADHSDDDDLNVTINATEEFILRAVGAKIGPDGSARKLPRR